MSLRHFTGPACARSIGLIVGLIGVAPIVLHAQERELNGLRPLAARVRLTSAMLAGDTTVLGYTVENLRSGDEALTGLMVATSAPVVRMLRPAGLNWVTTPHYRRRPIAGWVISHGAKVPPGQSSGELALAARGLPDVVRYWVVPDLTAHPPTWYYDDVERDSRLAHSDSGVTVGINAVATNATSATLASRLRRLATAACTRPTWMPDATTCSTLAARLDEAQQAIAAADAGAARRAFRAAARLLDRGHCARPTDTEPLADTDADPSPCALRASSGAEAATATQPSVRAEGYALLRPNVTYLLRRLPPT
jgi:hypothetical protein